VGFVLESAREIGVDSEKPEGLTS